MIIIGLTGSIGMGKSTTARMFADQGAPVYDADAEVRRLYEPGGAAVAPVEAMFPGVLTDGGIDRAKLADRVLGKPDDLARLNAIVWPLMGEARERFFRDARANAAPIVVLDVPLLLETGGQKTVDAVVVVSAPEAMQRERVLARPGMTRDKLAAILAAQMPDAKKRALADFVIDTSHGLEPARRQVGEILSILRTRANAPK
jgi:dephospho-CoA kinase